MSLKGTRTERNLLTDFRRRIPGQEPLYFLCIPAEKEGYEQISTIFLDTANNERNTPSACLSFWKVEK